MKIGLRLGRSAHAVKRRALQIDVELKSPTRLPRTERLLPVQMKDGHGSVASKNRYVI